MTITDLYRQVTGDASAHPRTIAAHLARLDTRRQELIRARAAGNSWRELAQQYTITHGSVQSAVLGGLRSMRKAIAGAPRYAGGHPGRGARRNAKGRRSSVATPAGRDQLQPGRTR